MSGRRFWLVVASAWLAAQGWANLCFAGWTAQGVMSLLIGSAMATAAGVAWERAWRS